VIETFTLESDELGNYETIWIPRIGGEYTVRMTVSKDAESVEKEKQIIIETISPHLTTPLTAKIILQGKMTKNRWEKDSIFHCRSRGSCSVNLTVETNREANVNYFWIFPDGSMSDEKNPRAIKLGYGEYEILLFVSDDITEETQT